MRRCGSQITKGDFIMKNFLCLVGAVASAIAIFAAVAIIVKKVKFKFVISSADAEPCDYDCDSCDDKECEARDADKEENDEEDFFDDVPVEEPEVEVEFTSEEPDKKEETEKTDDEPVDDSVKEEVDSELGK